MLASATMTLPPTLVSTKAGQVSFDGFSAEAVDITVNVLRSGCASTPVAVSSSGWTHYTVPLPSCGISSYVVFQVGNVYQFSSSSQALKIDNIVVAYP